MFCRRHEPYRRTVNTADASHRLTCWKMWETTAFTLRSRQSHRCSPHHDKRDGSNSCFQRSSLVYRHLCSPMSFSPPSGSELFMLEPLFLMWACCCMHLCCDPHPSGSWGVSALVPVLFLWNMSRATPLLLGSVLTADNGNIPVGRQGSSEVVKVMFRLSIWYSDLSRCVYR